MDRDRFEELKRKAAGEGVSDEEAAELGRLYAEERGEPYEDATAFRDDADAAKEEAQSQERREQDAAKDAEDVGERDRAQAMAPGEAREPDYEEERRASG